MSEGKELYGNPIRITVTWGVDGDGGGIYWELPPEPKITRVCRVISELRELLSRFAYEEDLDA